MGRWRWTGRCRERNSNGFLDEAVPKLSPKGSVGTSRAQRQGAVSTGTAVVGLGDERAECS